MPYRYLEHRADLLIEATGSGFPEALESAAQGMFDAIARVEGKETLKVSANAENLEELVVAVLSELLTQSEIEEMPLSSFRVEHFRREPRPEIAGIAKGKRGAASRGSVKAVTYHELSVKESGRQCTIKVLLDI
jgi:SHS2 domain-containing protein